MKKPRCPLVEVRSWRPDMFVDAWSRAHLACGHVVGHKKNTRPRRKRCYRCHGDLLEKYGAWLKENGLF